MIGESGCLVVGPGKGGCDHAVKSPGSRFSRNRGGDGLGTATSRVSVVLSRNKSDLRPVQPAGIDPTGGQCSRNAVGDALSFPRLVSCFGKVKTGPSRRDLTKRLTEAKLRRRVRFFTCIWPCSGGASRLAEAGQPGASSRCSYSVLFFCRSALCGSLNPFGIVRFRSTDAFLVVGQDPTSPSVMAVVASTASGNRGGE